MTWVIRSMNGAIPVVAGVEANTLPVRTSSAASRARAGTARSSGMAAPRQITAR